MTKDIFDKELTKPSDIPQVEQVLASEFLARYVDSLSRPYVLGVVRTVFDEYRKTLSKGDLVQGEDIRKEIENRLDTERFSFFTRVINATGIVVHTNLGRSPIGRKRAEALADRLSGYSNLEYDIIPGKRGKRGKHVSRLFALLTGSEAACMVNNNAAAVFLILNTYCKGKECIVSRSELIQIGGGFRIPDVMKASGALLKEIGTTNKVSFNDYEHAVNPDTGLIAKIHWSNFKITGFTESVDAKKLAALGKEKNIPVMYDLGSGSWMPPDQYGAKDEPSITNALGSGADLICFSGDKLFGGPQAGIILGSSEAIEKLQANPMYRAFRTDKTTLLMLEETVLSYLNGKHLSDIPAAEMLTSQSELLRMRADRICEDLAAGSIDAAVVETKALVGGGSAPEEELPSFGIQLPSHISPDELARKFRLRDLPVIGRIVGDKFVLDLKAVLKDEDELLIGAIREVLRS